MTEKEIRAIGESAYNDACRMAEGLSEEDRSAFFKELMKWITENETI